jgi:hypothetical protein
LRTREWEKTLLLQTDTAHPDLSRGAAMLQIAVPAEAGLIGSIIGYYFGVKSQQ